MEKLHKGRLARAFDDGPGENPDNSKEIFTFVNVAMDTNGTEQPVRRLQSIDEDSFGHNAQQSLPEFVPTEEENWMDQQESEKTPMGRTSTMMQRAEFEKMKQKFLLQAAGKPSDDDESPMNDITNTELEELEEENRRLRMENTTLRASKMQAEEETVERTNEAAGLLRQLGRLRSEVEDVRYRHQGEASALRQQLDETTTALNHQTEELVRWKKRLQEEEQRGSSYQAQLQRVEDDNRMRQDLLTQMEKRNMDLDKQLYKLNKERNQAMGRVKAVPEDRRPPPEKKQEEPKKEDDQEGVLGAFFAGTYNLLEATIRPSAH